MLHDLADEAPDHRQAGIRLFVLAYFICDDGKLPTVRDAAGLPQRGRAPGGPASRDRTAPGRAMSLAASVTTCGRWLRAIAASEHTSLEGSLNQQRPSHRDRGPRDD